MTTLRFILYDIADSDKIFIMTSNSYKGGGGGKKFEHSKGIESKQNSKMLGQVNPGVHIG